MARIPRNQVKSDFYHAIQRGVNRQIIFEDTQDYEFFLKNLRKFARETNVGICAYCLMNNHYHILIHDKEEKLIPFMRKINVSYAMYFNNKYQRTGYLFQGRYIAKPVNNISYFKHLIWYILRNPEKSGISNTQSFRWSSFSSTLNGSPDIDRCLLDLVFKSNTEFFQFVTSKENPLTKEEEEEVEKIENKKEFRQKEKRERLEKVIGDKNLTTIQQFNAIKRDKLLIQLLKEGFSIREIERNTGINRGIITRVNEKNKKKA